MANLEGLPGRFSASRPTLGETGDYQRLHVRIKELRPENERRVVEITQPIPASEWAQKVTRPGDELEMLYPLPVVQSEADDA